MPPRIAAAHAFVLDAPPITGLIEPPRDDRREVRGSNHEHALVGAVEFHLRGSVRCARHKAEGAVDGRPGDRDGERAVRRRARDAEVAALARVCDEGDLRIETAEVRVSMCIGMGDAILTYCWCA